MGEIASQITSPAIVYSTVYSDADQRTHQSLASPWTGEFPHKWPVTRKMFPFDDVIMSMMIITRMGSMHKAEHKPKAIMYHV